MKAFAALCFLVAACPLATSPACAAEPPALPAPDRLIETLRSGNYHDRWKALRALADKPERATAYRAVLKPALQDKDADMRLQAAVGLAALGVHDEPVLQELLIGMGQPHPGRYHAQPEDSLSAHWTLVSIGQPAVTAVTTAMEDERYAARSLALDTLGDIGPTAKAALPAIERALAKDAFPRHELLRAKWKIDGDSEFALQGLLPLLEQKEGLECNGPLRVLVRMGADAAPAMPALVKALERHKDSNVLWAVRELAPHAKAEAMPALRKALADPDLADDAAIALHRMGGDVKEIIPHQLKRLVALEKGRDTQAMQIVYTIVIFGLPAKEYAPEFFRLLKHDNPTIRRAAAWAICRLGSDDKAVEAALIAAEEDPDVAEEAARSLKVLRDARQ